MPRAILHIGTEKTGTTAIQAYLAAHRQRLRGEGFAYSAIPGGENHTSLAAYAQDDAKLDDLRMASGLNSPAKLAAFRERLERMIADEAAAAPDATFLFSSEHCHSRLTTPDEVERLHALLGRHFADIRIIVYLRRQDEVAVSHYSTLLKAGGTRAAILDSRTLDRKFLDYHAMLERWAGTFGRERLTVARFDRAAFPEGSIIPDFCARVGVAFVGGEGRRANESLRPPHQEFLRRINERLPRFVGGALNPLRGEIENYVEAIGSGSGRRPSAANARALYETYRASNEAVRAAYFPDRASLFDEDFDRYPEDGDAADLAISDALDIMAAIWAAGVQERDTLRARLAAQPAAAPAPIPAPAAKPAAAPAAYTVPAAQPKPAITEAPRPEAARPAAPATQPPQRVDQGGGPGVVNTGYQRDDLEILDYQLWQLGDQKLRGPAPDLARPYFASIGAAQVFGRFVPKPFPAQLAEQIGLPALNLGMSGAGPSFFLQREAMIDAANRARFVIVQLTSGRSVSNSMGALGGNQGVLRRRTDPAAPAQFAEDVYRTFLREMSPAELAALRAENRDVYVAEMQALLTRIERPKILLYWSKRPVSYREGLSDLTSYWADFPHFVNQEVVDVLKPFADHYVETVTGRGLPQPLFHGQTGAPVLMWPEDRFPSVQLRHHNHYYPSPEMNDDVAQALLPAARDLATRPDPQPAARPRQVRDVLVHMHIFKNAGSSVDRSLKESFGNDWRTLDPAAHDIVLDVDTLRRAAQDDPALKAISSHQVRLPFPSNEDVRFHPILFLRDPLLRARSVYDYERMKERRETSDLLHTKMAAEHDFRGWIEWCLSKTILSGPVANYQTRMCSITNNGTNLDDWRLPVTLRNFREAMELLAGAHVGMVEDFEGSLLRIERELHPYFPALKLLSYVENASIREGIPTTRSIEAIRGELGDDVYEQLCMANSYDLLLWRRFGQPT